MARIKHVFLKLFVTFQVFMLCLVAEMTSTISSAFAAGTGGGDSNRLSGMAGRLTEDMSAFSNTVLWAAMVVGVGLILAGAIKLTKREGEGGLGKALIFIVAGVLAVGIPALVKVTGGSLFGDGDIGNDSVGGVSGTKR